MIRYVNATVYKVSFLSAFSVQALWPLHWGGAEYPKYKITKNTRVRTKMEKLCLWSMTFLYMAYDSSVHYSSPMNYHPSPRIEKNFHNISP